MTDKTWKRYYKPKKNKDSSKVVKIIRNLREWTFPISRIQKYVLVHPLLV